MTNHHTLRVTQRGFTGTVQLGDTDISHAVRGVRLQLDCESLPTAELDLRLFEVDVAVDGALVYLPDQTRAALAALGWTPPDED